MAIIKKITLNGSSYDIFAASAVSATSAANVPAAGIQGNIEWKSVSALVDDSVTATNKFWTSKAVSAYIDKAVAAVESDIKTDLGSVYTVKGSSTFDGLSEESKHEIGNVYNLTTSGVIADATDGENVEVYVGDNVVWDGTKWDKLAASVNLDGYATEAYVQDEINKIQVVDGLLDKYMASATSARIFSNNADDGAWKAVTDYVDTATNNLTSADMWNQAYTAVTATSGSWNQSYTALTATSGNWDSAYASITGAVSTDDGMTAAGNGGKIATVGAITGYVDSKIADTVAETINIADDITAAARTEIPNVGAVKDYVDAAKEDALKGAETSGVNVHYDETDAELHIVTQYTGKHE